MRKVNVSPVPNGKKAEQTPSTLSLYNQNVQCLSTSFEELSACISELVNVTFISITEHWQDDDQLASYNLEGFKLQSSFCRPRGSHGGCAVYSAKPLHGKVRYDITTLAEAVHFECAAAEFCIKNHIYVIVSIYRSPNGSFQQFMFKFNILLRNVNSFNITYFIAGDFNIDFMKENSEKRCLVSLLESFGAKLLINDYTRITSSSKSCIDNIITNNTININYCNILFTGFSDHTAQVIEVADGFDTIKNKNTKYFGRKFDSDNMQAFFNSLNSESWVSVFNDNVLNSKFENFYSTFFAKFSEHFPLKLISNSKKSSFAHKNYPNVIQLKKQLELLHILSSHLDEYKPMYKQAAKDYNNEIIAAKKHFVNLSIGSSDNKSKTMWRLIKQFTGKERLSTFPSTIDCESANNFNEYFISAGSNALMQSNRQSCIQSTPVEHVTPNNFSMFFQPVTEVELHSIIINMKNKSSAGIDGIPTKLIKYVADIIIPPLCDIINCSLETGIFPEQLKVAIVIPLYKKGDIDSLSSYRPISLLSVFSKLFEKIVLSRIIDFFKKHKLFSSSQHGFLRNKNTTTAIFDFITHVYEALENYELPCGVFLDLSKAFDCIDHTILLKKLFDYGIRGIPHNWIKSYLLNRKQIVEIKSNNQRMRSGPLVASRGVPQGSILGPIFFIIFVNDFSSAIYNPSVNIVQYADDTNIIFKAPNIDDLEINGNEIMVKATNWFVRNKLCLNNDKTNCILFRNSTRLALPDSLGIRSLPPIQFSNSTKFLGILIDSSLKWEHHIKYICGKLSKVCYCLRIMNLYINIVIKKTIYFSCFQSVISYGIVFWGACKDTNRVFLNQKQAIRIMFNMKFRESCRSVFRKHKILTVAALYIYECVCFVKNYPTYFANYSFTHNHGTRLKHNFKYPNHRLTLTHKSALYMCLKLYNSLPNNLKIITSNYKYKTAVYNYLCDIEPYNISEYLLR